MGNNLPDDVTPADIDKHFGEPDEPESYTLSESGMDGLGQKEANAFSEPLFGLVYHEIYKAENTLDQKYRSFPIPMSEFTACCDDFEKYDDPSQNCEMDVIDIGQFRVTCGWCGSTHDVAGREYESES